MRSVTTLTSHNAAACTPCDHDSNETHTEGNSEVPTFSGISTLSSLLYLYNIKLCCGREWSGCLRQRFAAQWSRRQVVEVDGGRKKTQEFDFTVQVHFQQQQRFGSGLKKLNMLSLKSLQFFGFFFLT